MSPMTSSSSPVAAIRESWYDIVFLHGLCGFTSWSFSPVPWKGGRNVRKYWLVDLDKWAQPWQNNNNINSNGNNNIYVLLNTSQCASLSLLRSRWQENCQFALPRVLLARCTSYHDFAHKISYHWCLPDSLMSTKQFRLRTLLNDTNTLTLAGLKLTVIWSPALFQ